MTFLKNGGLKVNFGVYCDNLIYTVPSSVMDCLKKMDVWDQVLFGQDNGCSPCCLGLGVKEI